MCCENEIHNDTELSNLTPETQTTQNKHKKVSKKLLVAIAVVLVVAVVAAIVIPIFFPEKETIYVCVKEIHYNADGVAIKRIDCEYDEAGNLLLREIDIGETTHVFHEENGAIESISGAYDGTADWIDEYSYDEFGQIIEKHSDFGGDFYLECEYGKKGRILSFDCFYFKGDGDTWNPITYECEYDDNGNLIRITELANDSDEDGRDRKIQEYEYDNKGRLIAENFYYREGTYRNEFIYDGNNFCRMDSYWGTSIYSNSNAEPDFGLRESTEYEYDDGLLIEEIDLDSNGKKIGQRVYNYDKDGFLQELEIYSDDTKVDEIKYTCDEFGNIIEEEYMDGTRIERKYEELIVTHQEAIYFRRREGHRKNKQGDNYDSQWCYYLIPNPRWED